MKNIKPSLIREKMIKDIRSFFYERDFHEIIPEILNDAVPLEPNLHPFSTTWKTLDREKTFYLSMSPERGIKKMLAQGIGNCFAISKSFRNLERSGSLHNPEFLMLEWYREDAVYTDIMADVEELFGYLRPDLFNKKWLVISLKKLLEKVINDPTWVQNYDQLFVNEIESKLPKEPLFLVDFPTRLSPLCKPQKNNPIFAERFECYIKGIEIGNGNTENTDIKSVRKVFKNQQALTNLPIDEEFLNSLKIMDKKSYAGVGIGIDRLAMVFNNKTSI